MTGFDGLDSDRPTVRYRKGDTEHTLTCDIVAGCDGFHGVCRPAIPDGVLTTYDHVFPFGWLGILSESPPIKEMTYANHDNGFALCSRRSPKISRHYVQVAPDEDAANWSDDRFWNELHIRMNDARQERDRRGAHLPEGRDAGARLRGGADALRPAVPRRRCRPHRAADRREGAQSRGRRRARARARADGSSSAPTAWSGSTAIRTPACAASGRWCAIPGT